MQNSTSQVRTVADSSNTVEQHPSSPNNAKPYVGGSFCPQDNDDKEEFSFLKFMTNSEKVKLKWWQYLYAYPLKWSIEFALFNIMRRANYVSNKKHEFKKNLKYFNPIIKKDFWGDNKIEWVGRDKPLTDDEVEALWKSS